MPRPALPAALLSEVRRAAAFLLFRALEGLGNDIFLLGGGCVVRDAYKAIKVCMASGDAVVAFHGQNAHAQLSVLMEGQFLGLEAGGLTTTLKIL
jgi:hypothetical protein